MELKVETLVTLKICMKAIDAQTLKGDIVKSLEKLRSKENNP